MKIITLIAIENIFDTMKDCCIRLVDEGKTLSTAYSAHVCQLSGAVKATHLRNSYRNLVLHSPLDLFQLIFELRQIFQLFQRILKNKTSVTFVQGNSVTVTTLMLPGIANGAVQHSLKLQLLTDVPVKTSSNITTE